MGPLENGAIEGAVVLCCWVVRGVGPRDGGAGVSSAPERRKPSKRPEVRISHSPSLMAARVARTLCRCGFVRR